MKQQPLHIDVVTKYFYPVTAGIETNILETYSVMAAKGWDITIHTSSDEYLKSNSLPTIESIRGLHVKRYPFGGDLWGFMPDIDWENSDVICLHNFNVFFYRIFLRGIGRRLIGKRIPVIVLTPHGGFTPEWRIFSIGARILKVPYHKLAGPLLIRWAVTMVRAVSKWEAHALLSSGVPKEKIRIISNGIEREAFLDVDSLASSKIKQTVASLSPYIIQIGRIYPIKNYETAIRALARLPKNISYVIAGEAEKGTKYLEDLKILARDLGVMERVHFIGVIRGVDKYYLIRHAELMVHMAIWESFCNVVHEGMSQGLVCIVANNTALPYLIKDGINGFCIDTRDDKTLADKIRYVIENRESPDVRAMRARNEKEGLASSWSSVAEQMMEMYRNLSIKRSVA